MSSLELEETLSDAAFRGMSSLELEETLSRSDAAFRGMSSLELEETLSDAAFRGDVVALSNLLARDPNLLDKHYLKCEDKNVLHVAATLGNVEFFQAVLRANSSFRQDMCLARDRSGKNPIHLAASHGKVEILNLIKDQDWLLQVALEKTDREGTILHLCVKHNQPDALRLLLSIVTDVVFLKAKNEDGMTILHLAFYCHQNLRRKELIIYLIKNVSKIVNLKDASGKTALDLFLREAGIGERSHWGRTKRMRQYDRQLTHSLRQANAKQGHKIIDISGPKSAMMVVASLIATMAFQATISPQGGTWQDDSNGHRVGESVMAKTHPNYYKNLIRANTVAFVSSLSVIMILLAQGMRSNNSPISLYTISKFVMWLSVTAITIVYSISLAAIVPESARGSNLSASSQIAVIVIMVWSLVIITVVYLNYVIYVKNPRKPSTSEGV